MTPPLLRLDQLSAGYGQSTILDRVNLEIPTGGSLALLGRNGVGKSTLIASCLGLTTHHSGQVLWHGRDVSRLAVAPRARLGIGWVPQERLVFASLTVDEHLRALARPGPWNAQRVYRLFPSLAERRRNRGLQLSGGEQQMLALGRALVTNPRLLLLDEPMEGLAPVIVQQLQSAIAQLVNQDSLSLLIAEQHAAIALRLTQQVVVLDRGRIVHEGQSEQLLADPAALSALLAVTTIKPTAPNSTPPSGR